jgi:hypothetical protein
MTYGLNNGSQSAGVVRAVREVCAERAMQCVGFSLYPPSDDRVFSGVGMGEGAVPLVAVPTVSLGFQDEVGAHQMWLALNGGAANNSSRADAEYREMDLDSNGGQPTGLAENFVPRIFQLIHSAGDNMEQIDPATVQTAGRVYAALVERLDRQLDGVD